MNTEIDSLIAGVLMNVRKFEHAYQQVIDYSHLHEVYEKNCKIPWQYCGIIAVYSGNAYDELNTRLRGGDTIECNSQEYVDTFSMLLSEGLRKLDSYNSETVCRNVKCPINNCEQIYDWFKNRKGAIFVDPAFMSTSANWQPVDDRVMFKIKTLPSNSNAKSIMPIISIFQKGNVEREQEVLFDKNTLFKIENVENDIIYLKEVERIKSEFKLDYKYWDIINANTLPSCRYL